jgi:hypothetical protein
MRLVALPKRAAATYLRMRLTDTHRVSFGEFWDVSVGEESRNA